jgi:membrane-associated phospholipid phosphatase
MRRAILLGAAFVALTVAVQAGLLRPVDRYAIHHAAPLAGTAFAAMVAPADPVVALRPVVEGRRSALTTLAAIAFAPADTLSAVILVACAAVVLRRRGRPRAAAAWAAALLAGLAVEGAGKAVIDQIPLGPPSIVLGYTLHGSYPSGHTIRSVILAALGSVLWPRARPWLIAWVVFVTAVLELGALHVPSDIAGGFLAGAGLACAAIAYGGGSIRTVTPPVPVQSGGHAPAQASRPADVQAPHAATEAGGGRPGPDRGAQQPEGG